MEEPASCHRFVFLRTYSIQASFFLFLTTKKRRDIEAKDNSLMKWSAQNQSQSVKNAIDTNTDVKRRQNLGAQIAAEQIMEEKCEPRLRLCLCLCRIPSYTPLLWVRTPTVCNFFFWRGYF
jgi:hypothetical protein